ncbi:MAG: glycosyltransferase family 4 protein [Chloroflexi bacterium]|jgi:glycosyltransferase involved in cell wall biosynthesis|nr:glycosyltransferase family 4 protein [Chloroflexota bacterium]
MASAQRVLYVDLAPAVGGSVISLYYLVKGLDRRRYEPHVLLRASNPYVARFRALDVPVVTIPGGASGPAYQDGRAVASVRGSRLVHRLKSSMLGERVVHLAGFYARQVPRVLRDARAIGQHMAAIRPALVHLNDTVGVSRAGVLAARRLRLPAICHLRALDERNHFDRWLSRSLAGYVCISHAVDAHQRTLGGRVEPSWVVYNGLDLADMDQPVDAAEVRAELGLGRDDEVVGCVGRLVEWKGQRVFLEALARLTTDHPRLRGLIVGGAEANGAAYAQELAELTHTLGLDEVIRFTGFRKDVPRVLRAMDVMVHASSSPEPFGRVLIEGMAAGVLVIGTDAGAVPEIIEDGATGLLVPPGDAAAMAGAIARALGDPEQRQRWVRAARQVVEQRFTMQAYVSGIERVYKDILR